MSRLGLIVCGATALLAAPAGATPTTADTPAPADAMRIPEPDMLPLFLLGGVGLLVGHRLSRSKRR